MSKLPRPAKILLPILRAANFTGEYGSVGDRVYTWNPSVEDRIFPWIEVRRLGGVRNPDRPGLLGTAVMEITVYTDVGLPETEQLYEDVLEALYDAVNRQTVTDEGNLSSIKETMGATQFSSLFQDSWRIQGLIQFGIRPKQLPGPTPSPPPPPPTVRPPIRIVQTGWENYWSNPVLLHSQVTAGNTLIALAGTAPGNFGNPEMGEPTLNGSPVPGAYRIWETRGYDGIITGDLVSPAGDVFYTGWVLPNCPPGSRVDWGIGSNFAPGAFVFEVSGLGPAPTVGASSTGISATGVTPSLAVSSGTTAMTNAPAFVVGGAVCFGNILSAPGDGFTGFGNDPNDPAHLSIVWAGYKIADYAGQFTWAQTNINLPARWAAGVAAIVYGE